MSDAERLHRMLSNRHSYSLGGPIAQAAKQIAKIRARGSSMNIQSDLLLGCGCHFVNGGAVKMCERAVIRDGILMHLTEFEPMQTEMRLTEFDKDFLKDLKVTA